MANNLSKYWETHFVSKPSLQTLSRWNQSFAAVFLIQGIVILILSATKTYPVYTTYLTLDPLASQVAGHTVLANATKHLFDINMAYLVATFLFISAIGYWLNASYYRKKYEANLKNEVNSIRWVEYGLSSGLMIVAIGLLSGIYDLSTLLLIFSLVVIMNFTALVMEIKSQRKENNTNWLAYIISCFSGLMPWVALLIYVIGANVYGTGSIPTFVYWIYLSLFIFLNGFLVNAFLHFKKIGKWSDYAYTERFYMIISLIAKSLLAWQIFAGVLRP